MISESKKTNQKSFFKDVYKVVRSIPSGYVMSYGQIASYLGRPRSSRVVGWALHGCPSNLPWHRVVKQTGEVPMTDVFSPETDQHTLLAKEGVTFLPSGKVNMKKHRFYPEEE